MNSEGENSLEFWKAQSESYHNQYEECRQELEEFTSSSRELENELEKELSTYQQQNNVIKNDLRVLTDENRLLKEQEQRHIRRIDALEDQVKQNDTQKQSATQYRRELEQKNEELETATRNLSATLDNRAKEIESLLEAKALLENELDACRSQREVEQRLRDELKDLRDELTARSKSTDNRQNGQRPPRRRTIDETNDDDVFRLQSMAAGGDYTNGHVHCYNSACLEVQEKLNNAVASSAASKTFIQNLIQKITAIESELLNLRRGSLQNGHL